MTERKERKAGAGELTNVRHAIEVLMLLGKSRSPQHVRDIAASIGASKSTIQRILATLEPTQMVRFDPDAQAYFLGPGIIALHADYTARDDMLQEIRQVMEHVRQESGETVILSVLYGNRRLVLLRVESKHALRYVRPVGVSYPLHVGATSKVLLSALPDDEMADIMADLDMVTEAPNTITSKDELRAAALQARTDGFATSREEAVRGVAGCVVPVEIEGLGVAALGVFGPVMRFEEPDMKRYIGLLKAASDEIHALQHP